MSCIYNNEYNLIICWKLSISKITNGFLSFLYWARTQSKKMEMETEIAKSLMVSFSFTNSYLQRQLLALVSVEVLFELINGQNRENQIRKFFI